jgi:cytochrome b561
MPNDTAPGYSLAARVLHWVTAAIVLTMIPVGFFMAGPLPDDAKNTLYDLHRSMGALLIPIVIVRLLYRWMNPPPPLPADVPAMQQFAAHTVHWALYAILVVQPFVGWIATSAYRAPVSFFWLFELPPIWPEDRATSELMFMVHGILGLAISALILVHIAGALYHHFIRKDRILLRMVSG